MDKVVKFGEFLAEAKKDKKFIIDTLQKLLTDKPVVKLKNSTEKGMYSTSGVIKYFQSNDMSSQNATDALYYFNNDKELKGKMKSTQVGGFVGNFKEYPYYHDASMSKEEIEKIKSDYEKKNKEDNQHIIQKKNEVKKKAMVDKKEKIEKKSTAKRSTAKKTDPSKSTAKKSTTKATKK